ncbi:SCP2 sterol-binding domain-containing protein [Paenibacillus cremeus]|uniref:SCP2 sterol-binding domain-containing protein n=2 Tax=Paenibacillus cremeus TaxID=2163881 RepID=A0A559KIV7_9BACL|nr:SCP2 sterol-binding domain-containing protein [Paenibacillus cremeus]
MSIRDEFEHIIARMNANPDPIRSLQAVYQFKLGEGQFLQVKFHSGQVELFDGTPLRAECRIILSEQTLRKLINDQLNAVAAYMSGALKVEGKLSLAFKLSEVLKAYI